MPHGVSSWNCELQILGDKGRLWTMDCGLWTVVDSPRGGRPGRVVLCRVLHFIVSEIVRLRLAVFFWVRSFA